MECNDFIPRISLYIDASLYQPGILRLLRQLRPEWKQESIKFRTFEGGQTNSIIAVSCHEETMVIRIYGDNTEKIINRELERDSLIKLNKYTAAPPVYAYFTNGLCCGYAEGRQVELHELHDPKMGYRIAKELARVHTIPVSDEDSKHPLLYSVFLSSWLDQLPGKLNSEAKTYRMKRLIGSTEQLRKECEELKKHLDKLDSPVVFCHNDMLYKNIIYSKEKDSVTFIDLEYGGPNFRGFDLGDFFCGFAGSDTIDYSRYPNKEYQLEWLRMYLKEVAKIKGEDPEKIVTDDVVEDLYLEANMFALASHVAWAVWGLIQACYSSIDFDYLKFAEQRVGEYHIMKERLLSRN